MDHNGGIRDPEVGGTEGRALSLTGRGFLFIRERLDGGRGQIGAAANESCWCTDGEARKVDYNAKKLGEVSLTGRKM